MQTLEGTRRMPGQVFRLADPGASDAASNEN
jgi:hypothetical protein